MPILIDLNRKVDQYEKTYEDVSKFDDIQLIDKWFRVDSKPFKTALLNTIKKWSYMFKQHLMDDVTNSLKELDEFIKEKDKHLVNEVKEGDFEHLVAMMGHLAAVREKTNTYDNMFDPIKKKIELLKSYGQEVPDDVYDKLQVGFLFYFLSCRYRNVFFDLKTAIAREMDQYEETFYAS